MPTIIVRASALCMVLVARACGDDTPANPPVVAQGSVGINAAPMAAAGPVVATHGGAIVAAGPTQLEVVPHASGEVYAYPAVGIANPGQARITTTVAVEGGTRPVDMRWVPREHRYVGQVRGATIVPGPATVAVVVDDVHYVGASPLIVVAPAVVIAVTPAVIEYGYHGKHKYRGYGNGYGHGHGHGNGGVRVHVH